MKKYLQIAIITVVLMAQLGKAQEACSSIISNYTGPHNSLDLATKLNSSQNSLITGLSAIVKQTLIEQLVFDQGIPKGIEGSSAALESFFQSDNAKAVLQVIFDSKVEICSYATKPNYPTIKYSDFMALYASDPVEYAFITSWTMCYNCHFGMNTCCYVPGGGCWDSAIELVSNGNHYHVIAD